MRRAKKSKRGEEKERLNDAEKQEHLNKDEVVQSGDGDKKLKSDNLKSFEVYTDRYKVEQVNNKTDDDTTSLITQEANSRFPSLFGKSPPKTIFYPNSSMKLMRVMRMKRRQMWMIMFKER